MLLIKSHFHQKVTAEFFLIDLVNNLDQLAENSDEVLEKVKSKVQTMNPHKLERALIDYGNMKTKKVLNTTMTLINF